MNINWFRSRYFVKVLQIYLFIIFQWFIINQNKWMDDISFCYSDYIIKSCVNGTSKIKELTRKMQDWT